MRLKASVGDAEAATQNETLPATPDQILAQAQAFKQDITRRNRRTIHHYCLIGRNLNTLKIRDSLTSAARQELNYSLSYIQFLINLYKFYSFYPKIKRVK